MREGVRHVTLLPGSLEKRERPLLRLFCLPHAGAGVAGYHAWRQRLPAHIELALVHLPGREARLGEPPMRRMDHLVAHLQETVDPFLDVPYAIFGHSFGARVGFELTRGLVARGRALPQRLVVSGCHAPHLPDPRADIGGRTDDELIEEIARLGGTPPEILRHREMMALVLPVFRADLEVLASVAMTQQQRLPCGITAMAGKNDTVAPPESIVAWEAHTHDLRIHLFPGRHFFVHSAMDDVVATLSNDLLD